ncbi:MAG: hypothetical protein H6672_14625 [Anaerolineaceae bacterium]|nr:hypothetical protein [Anaerolineaceae bacterium]
MWDEMGVPEEAGFWLEPDFLLADLISGLVNKTGMPLGITLFMHGTVITGTLISEKEYLGSLSETFIRQAKRGMESPSEENIKAVEELFDFRTLKEDVDLEEIAGKDEDELDDIDMPLIRHLHLKDPMIIVPQPSITFGASPMPVMRIRLASIDSWMVGKMSLDDLEAGLPFDLDIPDDGGLRH